MIDTEVRRLGEQKRVEIVVVLAVNNGPSAIEKDFIRRFF
jgi:hypothetical protein